MWAQMITVRPKPGRNPELPRWVEQLKAAEQPGSGLLRSSAMQDQADTSRVRMLLFFESEEKARERSRGPQSLGSIAFRRGGSHSKRTVKESPMGTQDKASNKLQDVKGKVKETVGKVTGDEDLENEGKTDQVKASVKDVGEKVKDVGEKVKDAASEIKDAVTGK
jgi:uncharacterized protein YjbJ (UPF0337 family)